ncbi:peptide chain release factor N(5)-glutamine methyltransferase [Formosa sp. S-31]|uniref:peptide chain release factor N(5)-glutamine methyltransferase n=1 Tax=Formosa sp. S-31 TaxID=2790949 RepID=UPI003EB830AF
MRLKDIQNKFHDTLDAHYGREEVNHFFWLLCGKYFNIKRIKLALEPEMTVSEEQANTLFLDLESLNQHVPIQYILKTTEFFGMEFNVNSSVLIPRPETEELVSWIIDSQRENNKASLRILDIGTGSGCIAIALAKHFKEAEVFGVDVSKEAIKVAEQNAELNNVEVHFIHADILTVDPTIIEDFTLPFDIIVSNPPYVRVQEKALMRANVLEYEPHLALFVEDQEPLIFYNAITQLAERNLVVNGMLFFEINEFLGEEMVALLIAHNFKDVELKRDMFKKHRMIKGINKI